MSEVYIKADVPYWNMVYNLKVSKDHFNLFILVPVFLYQSYRTKVQNSEAYRHWHWINNWGKDINYTTSLRSTVGSVLERAWPWEQHQQRTNSTSRGLRFKMLHRKSHHHVDIVNRHVDIVNRRVDIVNRRVDGVAWQSAHDTTNRATVVSCLRCPIAMASAFSPLTTVRCLDTSMSAEYGRTCTPSENYIYIYIYNII